MLSRLSRGCFCTSLHRPWLFVGLGNPGDKYKGTRHNIGFEMIDVFAESVGIQMNLVNFKAIMGQGLVGDLPVILAKPQTYMNLSGESVQNLTRKAQLQEIELGRTTKQLKEARAIASEETARCKAAKEVIKSLTAQLKDMAEKLPVGSARTIKSPSLNSFGSSPDHIAPSSNTLIRPNSRETNPEGVNTAPNVF